MKHFRTLIFGAAIILCVMFATAIFVAQSPPNSAAILQPSSMLAASTAPLVSGATWDKVFTAIVASYLVAAAVSLLVGMRRFASFLASTTAAIFALLSALALISSRLANERASFREHYVGEAACIVVFSVAAFLFLRQSVYPSPYEDTRNAS